MKIAIAVGTRPEFIQMEPLLRECEKKGLHCIFIHSGQHYDYDMDKIFFNEMNLPSPSHYLGIGSKLPGEQIGDIIIKSETIFRKEKPDILLISGDTNTTLGCALAANKSKIKIGHLEAGMRSFDRSMPEEINRIIVDNISDYLFAPTQTGVENLNHQGISNNVFLTGDIMLDSIYHYEDVINRQSKILEEQDITPKSYLLLTLHREANTDNITRLNNILTALSKAPYTIIFPIHPRTREKLRLHNLAVPDNFNIIPPVGYFEFLRLISNSYKLLTDSGGAQKQAFFLSKPCITLRENTEWTETVDNGWNILVDDDEQKILNAIATLDPKEKTDLSLFGDGQSAKKIVKILQEDYIT
jgi:UDP-N-acetylglucosamine 2-epimerase (non-hydrolysing)